MTDTTLAGASPLAGRNEVSSGNATAHRTDIDGMRAIAVTAVVAFHAFPNVVHGGYVGVDIFFVLSGYLISKLLYRDLDAGDFSFLRFYSRRVRRIFPALIVVLLATMLFGYSTSMLDEWVQLLKNVVASATFVSNLYLLTQAGYFEGASNANPLLHLWSLGIEEQFYIVWPVLLVYGWRSRRRLSLLAVLTMTSFFANLLLIGAYPNQTFFLPFTRFWELWAGALLALVEYQGGAALDARSRLAMLIARLKPAYPNAGLVMIVGAIVLFRDTDPFPGWRAGIVVMGTVALLSADPKHRIGRLVLSNPLSRFLGLISYPLYLWHWPILTYLKIEDEVSPAHYRLVALGASVILAWLTYLFVEKPIRFGRLRHIKPGVLTASLAMIGAAAFIGWQVQKDVHDEKTDYVRFFRGYPSSHDIPGAYAFQCGFIDGSGNPRRAIDPACTAALNADAVFLWGDSHAQALRPGLESTLPGTLQLIQVATFGCLPTQLARSSRGVSCDRSNAFALAEIKRVRPRIVVLAQQNHHEDVDWEALAALVRGYGVQQVVLVGPCPEWSPALYRVMAKDFSPPRPTHLGIHRVESILQTDRLLHERYRNSTTVTYVSLVDHLCDDHGCMTYIGKDDRDGLVTFDYGHLTAIASQFVAREALLPAFRVGSSTASAAARPK